MRCTEHVNRIRQDRIGNDSLTFSEIFLNYRMHSATIISLYIHVIVMQRRTLIRSNNRESIHFENVCTGFGHVNYARTTTNQLLYGGFGTLQNDHRFDAPVFRHVRAQHSCTIFIRSHIGENMRDSFSSRRMTHSNSIALHIVFFILSFSLLAAEVILP